MLIEGGKMDESDKKETILERYLCYRSLLLAVFGKDAQSEALRWYLRRKREQPEILQNRMGL